MWLFHSSVSSIFCPSLLHFEIFIYLFVWSARHFDISETLLTFRDHYRVLHWMTDCPEETQRWGKKCINRENPTCFHWTAVTGQNFFCTFNIFTCKSQVFEEQLTFFFFRLFFLPSVAATFILFIFFTTCSTATSLLFQALRNGIGCITIERNIHIIYSPVCRIPFSEMLHV